MSVAGKIALGMASLCLLLLPQSAVAEPGKVVPDAVPLPPGVSKQHVHNQELTDKVLGPLQKYLEGYPQVVSGYAEHSASAETKVVEIKWKGDPPADVRALEGTHDSGVTVRIVDVTYSLNDMTAASEAIFTGARQGLVPMPISGGGNQAFDGVEVAYSADELKHLDQTTLTNQLTRRTGIPTTVVVGHEIQPLIIRN